MYDIYLFKNIIVIKFMNNIILSTIETTNIIELSRYINSYNYKSNKYYESNDILKNKINSIIYLNNNNDILIILIIYNIIFKYVQILNNNIDNINNNITLRHYIGRNKVDIDIHFYKQI